MAMHDGHRERLRDSFLTHGLDSFNELQALELLLAQTESGEKGYVSEISVPLASLGVESGDALRCLVILEEGNTRTMFSKADGGSTSTWQLIRL